MSLLATRDYRFGERGPGQEHDDLGERAALCVAVEQEIGPCLEFRKTFYRPIETVYAQWSYQTLYGQMRRSKRKQRHFLVPVQLYVLPARNNIHRFGISTDGRLFHQRPLRVGRDKGNVYVWFPIGNAYQTRLTNGVLSGYLLWSLRHRDGYFRITEGAI